MNPDRRLLLSGLTAGCAVTAWAMVGRSTDASGSTQPPRGPVKGRTATPRYDPARAIDVRDFGAVGDGRANDTDALNAASRHIERAGGGTMLLGSGHYLVGRQTPSDNRPWSFAPAPIIDIRGCAGPVAVIGDGATLRCVPGLRFGTFDPGGIATRNAMPFTQQQQLASPYRAAIWLQDNVGGVTVAGVEIDGRIDDALIGGPWGDTGWQINHCGLWLYNNAGPILLADLRAHHHGQDGLLLFAELADAAAATAQVLVSNVSMTDNGRQGMSLTGGRNVVIRNGEFSRNGRTTSVVSAPGAGIDLEAELSLIRDVRIENSTFIDNSGQGLVADNGDTAGVTIDNCRFVGIRNYALWPNKPGMVFRDCEIVGAMVRCFQDPAGSPRATQFVRCNFNDRLPAGLNGRFFSTRIDLGGSGEGTLFDSCTFDYSGEMQLPYSPSTVRYRNCVMRQTATERSYPSGIYLGHNRLDGNIALGGSTILGSVVLNGQTISRSG